MDRPLWCVGIGPFRLRFGTFNDGDHVGDDRDYGNYDDHEVVVEDDKYEVDKTNGRRFLLILHVSKAKLLF